MKTAFIFPAFITDYTGKEVEFLKNNGFDINDYIQRASAVIGQELPPFSYELGVYRNDELLSQIIAYLFACAINDSLRKKRITPEFVSGYSMGIYASLYAIGAIDLEVGVDIIFNAYKIVKDLSEAEKYGMGATIGLSTNDIEKIVKSHLLDVEIINTNNKHSLVVAGDKKDIDFFLNTAQSEGAMSVTKLIVNTPYHSKYLLQYSDQFTLYLNKVVVRDAQVPLISTSNQSVLSDSDSLKHELIINLTQKINWYATMQQMIKYDTSVFYEAGAGKDLTKIARFIQGNYKMKSIYKI